MGTIHDTLKSALERALATRLGEPLLVPDRSQRDAARGMSFMPPLVRAIVESRKTQTRRVIKPGEAIATAGQWLYIRERWGRDGDRIALFDLEPEAKVRWTAGRYMPREAARLWLRIDRVRIENLQQISPQDCTAEGIDHNNLFDPRTRFQQLWQSIYAGTPCDWNVNPIVQVIEFSLAKDAS
jgi:hypothetical protein